MYQHSEKMLLDIQTNWKKSWLKYFFAFTDLAVVLNAQNQLNENDFINAYLNSWSITRYFFKYFINSKEQQQFDRYIIRSQKLESTPNQVKLSNILSEPNQPIIASIETPLIKPENQSSSLVSKNLEPLASHTRVDSPVISVIQETKINSDGTDTNKKKEGKKSSQASSNPNASNGKKKNKNINQNSLFTTNKEDSSLSKQAKQPKGNVDHLSKVYSIVL